MNSPQAERPPALLMLPALAGLAVAILLARRFAPGLEWLAHPLLPLWCAFVLTYVAAATISLLPAPLGRPIDRLLDRHLSQWGAGVYGLIALSVFLRLEVLSVVEGLQQSRGTESWARELLRDWLVGFSVESLKNLISASIWPARLIQQHGVWGFLGFFAAASAVFELGRRWMPEQQARLEARSEKRTRAKADPQAKGAKPPG